ncbi:MAG: RNA-binding S4 domain-containing protein [Alicyclobacillus sp.]|nr:RNA-binding S4 domain-containing protein [Alicyclobacillus sp.]
MRLDKFLKVSRLIKRRTVAKEICDAGRVSVNGRPAKASSELKAGDVVAIRYGRRLLEVRVEHLADHARKEAADALYTVLREDILAPAAEGEEPAGEPS